MPPPGTVKMQLSLSALYYPAPGGVSRAGAEEKKKWRMKEGGEKCSGWRFGVFLWKVAGLAEGDFKKGVTLVSFLHWLPSTRFFLGRRKCLVWERFILVLIHVQCEDKNFFFECEKFPQPFYRNHRNPVQTWLFYFILFRCASAKCVYFWKTWFSNFGCQNLKNYKWNWPPCLDWERIGRVFSLQQQSMCVNTSGSNFSRIHT